MSNPILVAGAAGGPQGSTGRNITNLLLDRGLLVRALVRKLDARRVATRTVRSSQSVASPPWK
jgi:nucleoside-diphosphate-sugar epimerase